METVCKVMALYYAGASPRCVCVCVRERTEKWTVMKTTLLEGVVTK